MLVRDAMTRDPKTCSVNDTVSTVAGVMRKSKIGGLPVMDGKNIAGIITETDVLKLLMAKGPSDDLWLPSPLEVIELPVREFFNWEHTKEALVDIGSKKASEIMNKPVITISPDEDVEEAAKRMLEKRINRLAVIENEKLVGIITRQDIVWGIAGGEKE